MTGLLVAILMAFIIAWMIGRRFGPANAFAFLFVAVELAIIVQWLTAIAEAIRSAP